jgi:hypothetical protein
LKAHAGLRGMAEEGVVKVDMVNHKHQDMLWGDGQVDDGERMGVGGGENAQGEAIWDVAKWKLLLVRLSR